MTALVDELLEAWRSGVPLDLAEKPVAPPQTLDEAYAAQAEHLVRRLAILGGAQTGYKLGATSTATMQALGFAEPFHGPILSAWTHASPATLRRGGFFICAIELEVGFHIGADIVDPQIDAAGLRDSIAEVFPTLEVADSRFLQKQRPGPEAIVADLGNAGALVVGAPVANWRALDLETLPVTLMANGEAVASGSGALVVGGPLGQLLRFARARAAMGAPLKAGDIVSSGSCIPPWPAPVGPAPVGPAQVGGGLTLLGRLGGGHDGGLGEVSLTLV